MSWSRPLQDQQNGIIRYYLVTLRSVAGIVTRNISSAQQRISISGLRPYTEYNCTVQAETVALGPPNDIIQVNTPQDSELDFDSLTFFIYSYLLSIAPSGPPQNVVARATNSSTLSISWAPPVAGRLNGMIQRYEISITELETRTSQQFSTTDESIVIPNRHPYYRYSYIVAAVTTGQGPYSAATLIRMPEAGKIRASLMSFCQS